MNPPATQRVALTLLAHPDDAEILCGGTLIRLADLGWKIHIATATPGDCGTTTQQRWDISAVRVAEAQKAAKLIGAEYHCLDERDGLVVYDKPSVQKTIDLFRRVAPTLLFTHAPKDYMMDHEQVHLLARAASFVYGAPNISAFPLLAGTRIPWMYYCDPIDGIDPLGNEIQPTARIDISDVIDRKSAMLACHASQREWLASYHGIDEYIDAMKRHSAKRGGQMGARFGEAFVQHLGHAYPHDDLISHLLTGDK